MGFPQPRKDLILTWQSGLVILTGLLSSFLLWNQFTTALHPTSDYPPSIFMVTGVEGTGSTFFGGMLSSAPSITYIDFWPHGALGLMSSYHKYPGSLTRVFATNFSTELSRRTFHSSQIQLMELWNENSDQGHEVYSAVADNIHRVLGEQLLTLRKWPIHLYHFSMPFFSQGITPNLFDSFLWDLPQKFDIDFKLIVMYRDPVQAAHSNYRRNWAHLWVGTRRDVVSTCRSTEQHAVLLNAYLSMLPPKNFIVVNYNAYLIDPDFIVQKVTKFLKLNSADSQAVLQMSRDRYKEPKEPTFGSPEEVEWAKQFFSKERRHKWKYYYEKSIEWLPLKLIDKLPKYYPD